MFSGFFRHVDPDRAELTFWERFFCLLPQKPLPALGALYWHLTRRRVRARNRLRVASAGLPFPYALWINRAERNSELAPQFRVAINQWAWRPRFSIVLYASEAFTTEQLKCSTNSVEAQIYPIAELVHAGLGSIADGIAAATGDHLIPLRVGDSLSEAALFRFAEALQKNRNAAILYADQDERDGRGGRSRPWFKPKWNREMFLALDYVSDAMAIEIGLAQRIASNASNISEMVIAAVFETDAPIVHVPHILCHAAVRPTDQPERMAALSRHLERLGADCLSGPFGTIKVEWPLPVERPLVSVIVPTRDKLDLLGPCIESVLKKTDYREFEILIVDNGSLEERTADYLAQIERNPVVRVLSYPHAYNFSAINNFAARQARGAYLCLLNNDTEVVEPAWLTEMMRYAVRPEIGAVGAKLLYDDWTIQHAGVVVGIGGAAGHAHRFQPTSEPGYFRHPHVAQLMSAVTAACLVVQKEKFEAVGGLDEEALQIAFNDVDFCLKLEANGWRNVYVPHAVLLHHESKSRGKDLSPQNIDRYRRELQVLQVRWGTKTYEDPLHNPNLDRFSETFVIGL
jgi:O-antigen biosynthesis protein